MRNLQTLDREGFLDVLGSLPNSIWAACIEDNCIHLRRMGSETIFSPITAVYFFLIEREIHRGSFLHPDICERFHIPEWEMVEITYAEICCCGSGRRYDSKLRLCMLEAVAPLIRHESLETYLAHLTRETRLCSQEHW